MSDPPECNSLCERCSLLSFDDGAIGGQEVVGEDGVARLCFPESKFEFRPENWLEYREHDGDEPDYRLIRLDWELDEILPDMPHLSRSSELGCGFCQALRGLLVNKIVKGGETHPTDDVPLNLIAYLSLVDEGIEGLVIEASFNNGDWDRLIQTMFPLETGPGKSHHPIIA